MEKNSKSSKGFTKAYGDEGNMKIIIGIMDRAIKIIAKDEIEVYKGQIDLYILILFKKKIVILKCMIK